MKETRDFQCMNVSSSIHTFLCMHVIVSDLISESKTKKKCNATFGLKKKKGRVQVAQTLLKTPLFLNENKFTEQL